MSNPYITLAEFKELRRVAQSDTIDDTMFTNRIVRASRAIDDHCGRRGTGFWLAPAVTARTFHSVNGVVVPDAIGAAGYTITCDGETVTALEAWPANALSRGMAVETLVVDGAGGWSRTYEITAQWGWPEVPEPIKEATFLLANRRMFRRDSPEGVAGQSTEGPVRIMSSDTDVVTLITPYVVDGFA